MSFAHPIFLVALVVVPVAIAGWLWLDRRRTRRAAVWSTPSLLPNMVPARPGRRRLIPLALFLVGLALLLVGVARPQATLSVAREGATVVLALDVSGSMAAKDVRPTRLAAAVTAIKSFLRELPSKYRVALVTFSDRPTVRVPPSYDRLMLLRQLPRKVEVEGTALGDAAATAVLVAARAVGKTRAGAPHPPASVLLLSDGGQNSGRLTPAEAEAQARQLAVPVSTIALGTANGVVEQKLTGTSYSERIAVPAVPAALSALAQGSSGRFFAARSAAQLKTVYEDLGSRLARERKKREITAWTTMGALGFIVAAALLSGLWFQKLV